MSDSNMTSTAEPQPTTSAHRRLVFIDVLRGLALVAMALYHFVWDLEFFGYVAAGTAGTGGWKIFARLIASSFLFLAGYSLVLGQRPRIRFDAFMRRFAKIAGAAAVISIATWFAFPNTFIFFGILHSIAAASLVGLLFLPLPAIVSFVAAAAAFAAPLYLRSAIFDAPYLWWVGLSETIPRSNDYVPLLPWLAPFLLGLGTAKLVHARLMAWLAKRPVNDGKRRLWTKALIFGGVTVWPYTSSTSRCSSDWSISSHWSRRRHCRIPSRPTAPTASRPAAVAIRPCLVTPFADVRSTVWWNRTCSTT